MILQISRIRIMLYLIILFFLISLWFTIGLIVTDCVQDSAEGEVNVIFKFLAPMKPSSATDLIIERANDHQRVSFASSWITASTLKIIITEKNYPRGQKYYYKFKSAPTMIWPFYVWGSGEFQPKVKLHFVGIEAKDNVPSRGPVLLQFNTFVNPHEISNYIQGPEPGKLEPLKAPLPGNDEYIDYSRWQYWPHKKLKNLHQYTVQIKKGLPSFAGDRLAKTIKADFKTTPEFLIGRVLPRPGSDGVWLTRELSLEANQPLKSAVIDVPGLAGETCIKENQVKFIPKRVMMPGRTYQVKAHLTSVSNETLDYEYSFSTTNLGKNRWIELKVDKAPELWILEGNKTVKKLEVTLKPNRTIPTGTLYEEQRGPTSPKQSTKWFRLNADILLHTLPKGMSDDHKDLDLPKTYGCVYIKEENLNWLYNYLPQGFMLICH